MMATDEQAVLDLYGALIGGWNARDAKAMAGLYSPRGGQIGFDGSSFTTPSEIEQGLAPVFKDHPTARFVTIVREVRSIGDGVVILRAAAGMVPPGEGQIKAERNAIQTVVASRGEGEGWQIELFQNTPARFDGRPDEAETLTRELQSVADRQLAATSS
jgi:uncharacterized protein (TIGR02246 family)